MADMNRCVMEVLKWTEAKTVLQCAAGVSALWARVAGSDELWTSHLEAEELEAPMDTEVKSEKNRYKEAIAESHVDRFVLSVNRKVKVYQFTTKTFLAEFQSPADIFRNFSALAILSNKDAFVCGGGNSSAHLFSIESGIMTPLPPMFLSRNFHSAVCCYRKVYVFGGDSMPASKSAECFGLRDGKWRQLPDMLSERGSFNACYRRSKIYLCGGNTSACEVFDVVALQYTSLAFPLPEKNWTVSFFYQNQLVSIIRDTAYYLEAEGWEPVKLRMGYVPLGSSGAAVLDHFVYVPMNSCTKILQIDLAARSCDSFF